MVQEECNQNIPSPAVTGARDEEPKSELGMLGWSSALVGWGWAGAGQERPCRAHFPQEQP